MKSDEPYLVQYYNAVKNGKIIAGREIKTELFKLISDLNSNHYKYDVAEARKRIAFMECLCLQGKKPFYMQPVQLMLWQKAFIETIYSFKKYSNELNGWIRRFQDILLLVARKNGKSTLMAADGHTDLRIGDGGMDIVCASNDDRQAGLIWNEIDG